MRRGLSFTLGELAERTECELRGDPTARVQGVATLSNAGPDSVSFLGNSKYRKQLRETAAQAVYVRATDAADCPAAALLTDEPLLAFARTVRLMFPPVPVSGGVHPSAVVSETAQVRESAWIGPQAVVEDGARIGERVFIGPGCTVGRNCEIGDDTRLLARVTVCGESVVGRRVLIQPGAVIGGDGFGFARDGERWLRIPQIGRVVIGDDVEVGANTTIDRGAIDDTVIGNGAILDNQIQIGHNVRIGDNSAIAACTGIAGSTRFGRNCIVGGDVGVAGHLEIGDGVFLAAGSRVNRNLAGPGSYGGTLPVDQDPLWRRNVTRIRHLDDLAKRLKRIEALLSRQAGETEEDSG